MKKSVFCSLMLVLILSSSHSDVIRTIRNDTRIDTTNGPADAGEFERFMDSLILTQFKKENIPGGAFVFVKDGKILFMKGYGLANIETNAKTDPSKTIFRIGSISKVFTADAILQLADRGMVSLEKDVNTYLHTVKVPSVFQKPVTARHLITHTAGFDEIRPGTQGPDSLSVEPLGQFLSNKMVRLWEPGEIIMYSTYGITLGGLLVEDVSKKPFERYLSENIWKPLDMKRTSINVPGDVKQDIAMGYEFRNGTHLPQNWEWYHTTPASSVNSTAEDMAHWMIAHLNKGRFSNNQLISEKMMGEMLKHQFGMHPQMYGMAYGFFEEYYNDLRFLYHGGNMAGFNSQVVLIPEKNAGFFFVSHHEGSSIRENIQWAILDRYYKNTSSLKAPVVNAESSQRAAVFAGQYKYNVYCHSCTSQVRPLLFTVTANPDGTIQLNNRRWIEAPGKLLFIREDGKARIAFRQDSSGVVTHMYFGGTWSFEKLK